MKKAIVLMLALILTMSLALPAAAAGTGSPVAEEPVPELTETEVKTEDGILVVVEPVAADAEELTKEETDSLAAAQKELANAAPKGMKVQYFFFAKVTVKGEPEKEAGPVSVTLKLDKVENAVVKQFVDGKWVELEAVVNADGTLTIKGVVEAPMAFFTK